MNNVLYSISLKFIFILFLFTIQNCNSNANNDIDKNTKVYYESSSSVQEKINNSRKNAITESIAKSQDAIVGINVTEVHQVEYRDPYDIFDDPFFRRFFGGQRQRRTQEYKVQGLGSGFIISPDGYILTNHHVAGNASKVIVTMTNGKKYNAEIIGADKTTDVCLLKIEGSNFPYIQLGNSDNAIIGEWVIAFGNPFGLFDINAKPTVTVGVISNTGVSFSQNDGRVYKNMIQTDAAISSGNSGGPLVNALGEVIGMNTVIFSTAQTQQGAGSIGIGFSIPINRVKQVIDIFKQNKQINRNFYTGLDVREIDEQIVRYLKLNKTEGVYVFGIERNSPAEQADLQPGDVILEIDGNPINRADDYAIQVNDAIAGQVLKFKVLRDGKQLDKSISLKPRKNK